MDARTMLSAIAILVSICTFGLSFWFTWRSSIAASLLQSRGYPLVSEIAGGLAAWDAANLPTTSAESAESNRM